MARIMGVDYGDARTGVALSDPTEYMASGLCTVFERDGDRLLEKLTALVKEHRPAKIVLGLPVNMDGSEGERAAKARAFGRRLEETCGVTVELYDERCSTMVAHTILNESLKKGSGGKKRRQVVDTLSAEIILQDYLDRNGIRKTGAGL